MQHQISTSRERGDIKTRLCIQVQMDRGSIGGEGFAAT